LLLYFEGDNFSDDGTPWRTIENDKLHRGTDLTCNNEVFMNQTLLSIPDFCERYRVSRTTVYRQANAGNLSMLKVGRATRIRFSDAEAWAANLNEAVK
jgi:excisionase family DNA binding protein